MGTTISLYRLGVELVELIEIYSVEFDDGDIKKVRDRARQGLEVIENCLAKLFS